jgi:hypothetical protein
MKLCMKWARLQFVYGVCGEDFFAHQTHCTLGVSTGLTIIVIVVARYSGHLCPV